MEYKLKFENGRSCEIYCESDGKPLQDKINAAEERYGSPVKTINGKEVAEHSLGGFLVGAIIGGIAGNMVAKQGLKKTVKSVAKKTTTIAKKTTSVAKKAIDSVKKKEAPKSKRSNYVPNRLIDSIETKSGKKIDNKDIIDGAHTKKDILVSKKRVSSTPKDIDKEKALKLQTDYLSAREIKVVNTTYGRKIKGSEIIDGAYVKKGVFANGGAVDERVVLSFSFNEDNVNLKDVIDVVKAYSADYYTSGDMSERSLYVTLRKSKALELKSELKAEFDVYDFEIVKSRYQYAQGGGVSKSGRYTILAEQSGKQPLTYSRTNDKNEISKLVKEAQKDFSDLGLKDFRVFVTDEKTDDEVLNYGEGGSVEKFNWKKFTLSQLLSILPEDVEFLWMHKENDDNYSNFIRRSNANYKSVEKIHWTISDSGQATLKKGSENIYLDFIVYDDDSQSETPYVVSIYSKDNHLGLKKFASELIQKFKNGGSIDEFEDSAYWISKKTTPGKFQIMRGDNMTNNIFDTYEQAASKAREMNSDRQTTSGEKNAIYLKSISPLFFDQITSNIAKHYGTSKNVILDEVTDEEAEMLYEYIANDPQLRMKVYEDMQKSKFGYGGGVDKYAQGGVVIDYKYDPDKSKWRTALYDPNTKKSIAFFNNDAEAEDYIKAKKLNKLDRYFSQLYQPEINISSKVDRILIWYRSEYNYEISINLLYSLKTGKLLKSTISDEINDWSVDLEWASDVGGFEGNAKDFVLLEKITSQVVSENIKYFTGDNEQEFYNLLSVALKAQLEEPYSRWKGLKPKFFFGGTANTGLSWHLDRKRHNKSEKYEKPLSDRKRKFSDGGTTSSENQLIQTLLAYGFVQTSDKNGLKFFSHTKRKWYARLDSINKDLEVSQIAFLDTPTFNGYSVDKLENFLIKNKFRKSKFEDGGMIDLFETPDQIPPNVMSILEEYSEGIEDGDYQEIQNALAEIQAEGYTFDYYVDGSISNLRPINKSSEFAQGGMTEHGLRLGDKIIWSGWSGNKSPMIEVRDKEKKNHYIDLDQGIRYEDGGKASEKYKIVEGNDHYNNKPLFQVVGIENDYVGEWHSTMTEAQNELNSMHSKKYASGGIVGQDITFNHWSGDIRKGIVTEQLEDGQYAVSSGFGSVLVNPDDIISVTAPKPEKKFLGIFEEGGGVGQNNTESRSINYHFERAKKEILEDVENGIVPNDVDSFKELHEYVDANGYGGFFEENYAISKDFKFENAVQNKLDKWIKSGGLKSEKFASGGGVKNQKYDVIDLRQELFGGNEVVASFDSRQEASEYAKELNSSYDPDTKMFAVKKKFAKGGSITFSDDDQEGFDYWIEDGNVRKNSDGTYSTQDAQYRNKLTLDELKRYFVKEYLPDSDYLNPRVESNLLTDEENDTLNEELESFENLIDYKDINTFSSGGGMYHTMILLDNGHILTINWDSKDVQYSLETYPSIDEYAYSEDGDSGWDNEYYTENSEKRMTNLNDESLYSFLYRLV